MEIISIEESNSSNESDLVDVEEAGLVASYLRKVTPEIAREFLVSVIDNNFIFCSNILFSRVSSSLLREYPASA